MKTISKLKQILMQSFSKAIALFVALFIFSLTSCEKPNPNDDPSNDTPTDTTAFVMVYEDFITPEDVVIENSDTTEISISQMFAEKMGIETFTGRTVTIWRSINTVPFIRKITSEKVEGDKIIITSVKGEFADMFENVEFDLNTDLYINKNYAPKRARRHASGPVVNDVSAKYTDAEGIIHPAVIIFEEEEINSPVAQRLMTRTGTQKNYFTAEELVADNASFQLINIDKDFKKFDNYIGSDSTIRFMGKLGVEAKISATANVSVGFFELKKFETIVDGKVALKAKTGLGFKISGKKDWENVLYEIGTTHVVFWVGPIPIPFTIESNIKNISTAKGSAALQVLTSEKVGVEFQAGCRYKNGSWEGIGRKTKVEKQFALEGVQGSASAELSTGVFIETGIMFATSAGPIISVGPTVGIKTEAEATHSLDDANTMKIKANVNVSAGLAAEIGTKIKLLGYNLGKWSKTWNIFSYPIVEKSWDLEYNNDDYHKMFVEWMNALDTAEWDNDIDENTEVVD